MTITKQQTTGIRMIFVVFSLLLVMAMPLHADERPSQTNKDCRGILYRKTKSEKHKSPAKGQMCYVYSSGVITVFSDELSFELYEIEFKGWNQDQYLDLHEYSSFSIQTGPLSGQFDIICHTSMGIFEGTVTL